MKSFILLLIGFDPTGAAVDTQSIVAQSAVECEQVAAAAKRDIKLPEGFTLTAECLVRKAPK